MKIDDHVIFAAWLYAVRPEHVTMPMRVHAKVLRFGMVYGRMSTRNEVRLVFRG